MTDADVRGRWRAARMTLLAKEKALTRLRDEVAAERRALPRVPVENYVFEGPLGQVMLSDLFAGKSQLLIYHFMLGPAAENPCKSCSFWAEHFDSIRVHLPHRDAELAAVSRAPIAKIEQVRARMGWRFPWVSSCDSPFNFDFRVSFTHEQEGQKLYNFDAQSAFEGELPGLSVFARDPSGQLFHTYSTYSRGLDALNGTYQLIDLLPKGRNEGGKGMAWLRHKDRYQA
ncbi:MAG: DUF899 domain-containing protein [Proteobacteria bacterium]|nr:DUF899 domain-containing protein [Pseudomonadota bacterium]